LVQGEDHMKEEASSFMSLLQRLWVVMLI